MTSYDAVIKRFLRKISDYNLLSLPDAQRHEDIIDFLEAACGYFERLCLKNLTLRNNEQQYFEENLSQHEINILSELMVQELLQRYSNRYNDDGRL